MSSQRRRRYAYLEPGAAGSGLVLAIAHRGGGYQPGIEGLENTRAAFTHAVELGFCYLETDVHVTRDGVLLAFHDASLDRLCDRTGAIADLSYTEVRAARVGGREEIPTMASLLQEFPHCRFNIDVKSAAAAKALAVLLEEHQAHGRVLVGSFSRRRLASFRRLTGGRVATAADPWEVALFRFLPSGRLADWLSRGRVAALQVPVRAGRVRVVTSGLVRRAHAAGKHVHVWTVDDPGQMHRLLDEGVDGLISDRTDILKSVLQERDQWFGGPCDTGRTVGEGAP